MWVGLRELQGKARGRRGGVVSATRHCRVQCQIITDKYLVPHGCAANSKLANEQIFCKLVTQIQGKSNYFKNILLSAVNPQNSVKTISKCNNSTLTLLCDIICIRSVVLCYCHFSGTILSMKDTLGSSCRSIVRICARLQILLLF